MSQALCLKENIKNQKKERKHANRGGDANASMKPATSNRCFLSLTQRLVLFVQNISLVGWLMWPQPNVPFWTATNDLVSTLLEHTPTQKKRGGNVCADHRTPGMVDLNNVLCKHAGCGKRALYNSPEAKRGKYCSKHKPFNYVNVVSKKCQDSSGCCQRQPYFNFEGQGGGRFCSQHKLTGMVDVKSPRCKFQGTPRCHTQPTFNYLHEKRASFCSQHKLPGMVDIRNRKEKKKEEK